MVVAMLALFVALGGSAYAAGKIGTKNIKANAITTSKIKKNAITTTKIKNEAITGAKIKESSLGPVPTATNATNAVHATNATNATNAENARNWSRYYTGGLRKASGGQTVALGAIGPFSFFGECIDNGGGFYEARTYLMTSQPKSFSYASNGSQYFEGDLEPGEQAELGNAIEDNSPFWYGGSGYESDWTAASPDGSLLLQGFANNGVNVFGANCAFNLTWVVQS
ncbi:MAG: hypothetical protein WA862_02330 [Solirubrobacterales bacterium]